MATTILSTTADAFTVTVVTTNDGSTPVGQFAYAPTPPDGRSQGQWQTDCQNAALGIVSDPALGDGGPDASVSDDTLTVTG